MLKPVDTQTNFVMVNCRPPRSSNTSQGLPRSPVRGLLCAKRVRWARPSLEAV